MRRTRWSVGLMVAAALCGCAVVRTAKRSESKLALLRTGESRDQVIRAIGSPALVLPPQPRPEGGVIQFEQYRLFPKKLSRFVLFSGLPSATIAWWKTDIWEAEAKVYWLKYLDHKLEKWGSETDLADELPSLSSTTLNAVVVSTSAVNAPTVSTTTLSSVEVSTSAVAAVEISTFTLSSPATSTGTVTLPAISSITAPAPLVVSSSTVPTQEPPSVSTSTR